MSGHRRALPARPRGRRAERVGAAASAGAEPRARGRAAPPAALRRRGGALLAPARAARVGRGGPARAARRERAGDRRGRARLAGRRLPRGRGRGAAGDRRRRQVELSNLPRQHLHFTPDVGVAKAETRRPSCASSTRRSWSSPTRRGSARTTPPAMLEGQDLVVDCSDSFATRYAVNAACCAARVAAGRGRRGRDERARDGDPAGAERVLPLRVPGAPPAAAPTLRGGRRARPGGRRDRLAAGARGAEAAGRLAARCSTPSSRSTSRRRTSCASSPRRADCPDCGETAVAHVGSGTAPRAGELRRDVAAAHERDPAARGVSSLEILAAWPGVHALLAHRVAHALRAGVPLAPRTLAVRSRAR